MSSHTGGDTHFGGQRSFGELRILKIVFVALGWLHGVGCVVAVLLCLLEAVHMSRAGHLIWTLSLLVASFFGGVMAFALANAVQTLIDLVQDANMMKGALMELLKERRARPQSGKADEQETA